MEALLSRSGAAMSEAAFDRLVQLHRTPLERYVCGLGASREDAEEIAATALLRAYQQPPASMHEREWRPWLWTVARNLHVDARRRRQLRLVGGEGVLEAIPAASAPVDQIAATAQEARQICAEIALLPPTPRAAIYLREMRGLSYEEISAELGITQRAVTTTLERARAILKERRSGLAHALGAVSCAPLAIVRRGARAMHPAFSASAAKLTVPVLLAVTAGGGTLVAQQHPWTASPARTSGVTQTAVAHAARPGIEAPSAGSRAPVGWAASGGQLPGPRPSERAPVVPQSPPTTALAPAAPADSRPGDAQTQPLQPAVTPDAATPPGGSPPATRKARVPATPPKAGAPPRPAPKTPNAHANVRAKAATSAPSRAKTGQSAQSAAAGKAVAEAARTAPAAVASSARASEQRAAAVPQAPGSPARAATPAAAAGTAASPPVDAAPPAAADQVHSPAGSPPVDAGQGSPAPAQAPENAAPGGEKKASS